MIKKILLICVALLFLTACGKSEGVDYDYRQGHEGLTIDFSDNSFSSYIYEGNVFYLNLVIENEGATDVEGARIVLSTERDLIEDFENVKNLDLLGRTKFFDQGELKNVPFELTTKKIPVTEEIESKIRVDICYPYRSLLSTSVCIESDTINKYEDVPKGCPAKPLSFNAGQGAPIVITDVITKMMPSKNGGVPVFEITVEDFGSGTVLNKENYEQACSGQQYGRENYGVVDVGNIYLGNDKLECTKSVLKLEKLQRGNEFYETNRAVIKCTGQEIAPREPYIENLRVDLTYGYKDYREDYLTIVKK